MMPINMADTTLSLQSCPADELASWLLVNRFEVRARVWWLMLLSWICSSVREGLRCDGIFEWRVLIVAICYDNHDYLMYQMKCCWHILSLNCYCPERPFGNCIIPSSMYVYTSQRGTNFCTTSRWRWEQRNGRGRKHRRWYNTDSSSKCW